MAFGAVLAVTFGSAALAGASLGPLRNPDAGHGHADAMAGTHGAAAMGGAGLGVAEGGYVLLPDASAIPRGRRTTFSFRVLGPDGRAVTHFDVAHERRMHLIVVRRDLTGYQHVHPTLDAGGRWSVSLRLPAAGVYRAFADFSTYGAPMTLATDLFVGGSFRLVPLAAPSAVHTSGGYTARLSTTTSPWAGQPPSTTRSAGVGEPSPASSPTSVPTSTSSPSVRATSRSSTSIPRSRTPEARSASPFFPPKKKKYG